MSTAPVPDLLMERPLPASPESEKVILGAILTSGPEAYITAVSAGLLPGDMVLSSHREIFRAMMTMGEAGHHIDTITLVDELKQHGRLNSVGGVAYITSLPDGLPVRVNVRAHVQAVREKSKLRRLIAGLSAAIGGALDGNTSRQCIDHASEILLQLKADSEDATAERVIKFSDQVIEDWERIANSDEELVGRTTGVQCLDLLTGGARDGELWMLGGRTGDGKTSLALQMAAANLRQELPVGLFSLEMSKAEILQRLWSHQGRIPFRYIRKPRRIEPEIRLRIKRAAAEVATWPLFVQDGSLTVQQLVVKAKLLIRQERVRLLIVDYVQIVGEKAKDERERMTRVSNALRDLAKSEGVPLVALSQLNRPKDRSLNERPNKFSLKESGSLENDSHTILLTYRPVDQADQYTGEDWIVIAKQRHGPVSLEPVYFEGETFTFKPREIVPRGGQS